MMVRVMMLKSPAWMGMTGWMLRISWTALDGPTPKLVLDWKGMLMRSATGFCVFFASSVLVVLGLGGVFGVAVLRSSHFRRLCERRQPEEDEKKEPATGHGEKPPTSERQPSDTIGFGPGVQCETGPDEKPTSPFALAEVRGHSHPPAAGRSLVRDRGGCPQSFHVELEE